MPYTTNPHMPRLRHQIACMVLRDNWSTREVARYTGFNQSTIVRWVEKARYSTRTSIPTTSSKPHSHARQLSCEIVSAIVAYRKKYRRCADVLHYLMIKDGYSVSLSSVKRTLKRNHLIYPSPWKKWHQYPPRPVPEKPGVLVELDTMMDGVPKNRLCAYALIDVCSRWAYAYPAERISTHQSLRFVNQAQETAPFRFKTLQSDHGPEFSKYFTTQLEAKDFVHRHSRVRRPTDNGHVERFIRTLQEECLIRIPRSFDSWQKEIPEYIRYYNTERPHMGLNMKSPLEVMQSY